MCKEPRSVDRRQTVYSARKDKKHRAMKTKAMKIQDILGIFFIVVYRI